MAGDGFLEQQPGRLNWVITQINDDMHNIRAAQKLEQEQQNEHHVSNKNPS